jgi:hypothetical protein
VAHTGLPARSAVEDERDRHHRVVRRRAAARLSAVRTPHLTVQDASSADRQERHAERKIEWL